MATLQILHLRRVRESGEPWDIEFKPGLNLLIGEENTSKTTTLRAIDFCLGDGKRAQDKFGRAVAGEYQRFELRIAVNGQEHLLTRNFKVSDEYTRVNVDGVLMNTAEFNAWIAGQLGWPQIRIPHGRAVATVTNEQLLTFRSMLRHLFRNADSWTSFAFREEEYWRQAVVAFLLGLAEQVYFGQSTQVRIRQSEQEIRALEQRRIDLRATLNDVVQRTAAGYRQIGVASFDTLHSLIAEIELEIGRLRAGRELLASELKADPTYDARQDAQLAQLNQLLQDNAREDSELTQSLSEQHLLLDTFQGDIRRLERARLATSALKSMMVTSCPACYQDIDQPVSEEYCYVCHQPIEADPRERRLQLEERTLKQEAGELAEIVTDLEKRLSVLRERSTSLSLEREALLAAMDRERRELIAPALREFERLHRLIGQMEQRRETLVRLSQLTDLVEKLDREQKRVEERLARLNLEAAEHPSDVGLLIERTNRLASLMNGFFHQLPTSEGVGGLISLNREDFGFYVGRDPWDTTLGHKRRVFFLLSYHYAYLCLAANQEIPHPGLCILDNPFQQDADPNAVETAVQTLQDTCVDHPNLQVIVATRRSLPQVPAHRVLFTEVFDPEPIDSD